MKGENESYKRALFVVYLKLQKSAVSRAWMYAHVDVQILAKR